MHFPDFPLWGWWSLTVEIAVQILALASLEDTWRALDQHSPFLNATTNQNSSAFWLARDMLCTCPQQARGNMLCTLSNCSQCKQEKLTKSYTFNLQFIYCDVQTPHSGLSVLQLVWVMSYINMASPQREQPPYWAQSISYTHLTLPTKA